MHHVYLSSARYQHCCPSLHIDHIDPITPAKEYRLGFLLGRLGVLNGLLLCLFGCFGCGCLRSRYGLEATGTNKELELPSPSTHPSNLAFSAAFLGWNSNGSCEARKWHSALQQPRWLRALGLEIVHIQASSHLRHLAARKLFLPPKLGSPATNPFIEDIESYPLHMQHARQPEPASASSAACWALNAFARRAYDLCSGLHLHVCMGMCLCLHTYLHQASQLSDHPCVLYIHGHQRICRSIHLLADTR